jgi:hypothetical protein
MTKVIRFEPYFDNYTTYSAEIVQKNKHHGYYYNELWIRKLLLLKVV